MAFELPFQLWTVSYYKVKKGSKQYFHAFLLENINIAALLNSNRQQCDWWACPSKANQSCNAVAHAALASLLLDGRALGNRLCLTAGAKSAASMQGWLFVGGMKSGYYFKRNSHTKNVGFKINKCAHGSWTKLEYKSNSVHWTISDHCSETAIRGSVLSILSGLMWWCNKLM